MADLRKHSSTSNIVRFTLKHATTGDGLTGLTEASSGLIISTICDNEATPTTYTVAGSTIETITTLGTFAAPTATKCRFKKIDDTNHPGLYEFQFADARFSVASAKRLVISVSGATNLLDADYEIQLVAFDPYDTVRLGLTALPNAAAEAAGGLYTRGSGAGQINQNNNGQIDVSVKRWDGVALIAPDTPGAPKVTIIDGTGQGELLTGAGIVQADVAMIAGSAPSATNMVVVFGTDFASNYDTTADRWKASLTHMGGTVLGAQVSTNWLQFWQNDALVSGMIMDQADAYAALAAFNLDHLVGTAAGIPAIPAGTYLDQIMDDGTAVYDRTTDSLQAQRDRTVSSHTAADVWAVATRVLTAGTNIVLAKGVGVTGFNDLSAAQVNAEVLDVMNVDTLIDGKTFVQATQIIAATTAGRVSGAGTGTEVFKGLDEATTRVTVTCDASGNRTDIVYA